MKVIIYSTTNCKYCQEAKKYLDNLGISYSEKNISLDKQSREYIIGMGIRGVPYTEVSDGKVTRGIRGFSVESFDKEFKPL